ncbi:MAG: hypothetical protein U0166_19630 [Acidobacteriota bacterium]
MILFDIDGTLIRCGDAPRRALARALTGEFGSPGRLPEVKFGGKTDRIIVRESLGDAPAWDDPAWPRFWSAYAAHLAEELVALPPTILPGVPSSETLAARPGA